MAWTNESVINGVKRSLSLETGAQQAEAIGLPT